MDQEVLRLEREVSARFYLCATGVVLYLPILCGQLFRSAGFEVYYLIAPPFVVGAAGLSALLGLAAGVWSLIRGGLWLVPTMAGLSLLFYAIALFGWLQDLPTALASASLSVAAGLVHMIEAAREEARQRRGP